MTVQGIGKAQGYYQATPSQRQVAFRGDAPAQTKAPKKKSFVGTLIKLGVAVVLVAKGIKTGKSWSKLMNVAKKNGTTSFMGKAKVAGSAYLRNLNPKNWNITKKIFKPSVFKKETVEVAGHTAKVSKKSGAKIFTDKYGSVIVDNGGSYTVVRGDAAKKYLTEATKGQSKPGPMKMLLEKNPSTLAEEAAKANKEVAGKAFRQATGTGNTSNLVGPELQAAITKNVPQQGTKETMADLIETVFGKGSIKKVEKAGSQGRKLIEEGLAGLAKARQKVSTSGLAKSTSGKGSSAMNATRALQEKQLHQLAKDAGVKIDTNNLTKTYRDLAKAYHPESNTSVIKDADKFKLVKDLVEALKRA